MHYGIVNEYRIAVGKLSESGFSRFTDCQDWDRFVMELSISCQIIKSREF